MAGRPPVGATFEVERVGQRRSRESLAAVAWVAVLGGFVGLAVLGRGPDGPAPSAASPAVTASTADLALLVPAPGDHVLTDNPGLLAGPAPGNAPIDLDSPAIGPVTLRTPQLTVVGTVNVRAQRVQIALQTRNERTMDQRFVDVSYAFDALRPDQQPTFRAVFDLRAPRRLGTMWIEVTVYDANGRALAYERRPFIVGPIRGA